MSWGGGNRFHLESLTGASCTDNPSLEPDPPYAPFDTYSGRGSGTLNGVSGATAEWTFVDGGEPAADSLSITVKDALGQVVLSASGSLERGNLNAHDVSDGPDSGVFILRR